ncbi:MAG: hypothetical protein BGO01_09985 [Armatimonadetes bacterium 55-13]|nr:MAG: hypothetical protein BGO01_09985 [Armatimonadetes bacterium 55-13]
MNFRGCVLGGVVALASVAMASDEVSLPVNTDTRRPHYYFNIFGGQSALILGSEDRRVGIGVGLGWGRPEPRFTFKKVKAELVYSVYYDHTGSRGASGEGPNQVESLGFLVYARYAASVSKKLGYYVNVGLGLQYSNQQTVDLSSKINSTPMLGVGLTWDTSNGEASLGLGLLHISNAGTVPPNQGQNQVYLMYGWRF